MSSSKKKVLLVEDDNMISSMYKIKLETEGFAVLTAEDGVIALELIKKDRPDIIMLDIILPRLDGFSVLEEVRKDKDLKDLPVVLLTNLGTEEDKAKGKKMGATDYLVKADLTPGQISDKIKEILK
jgi:two-component system, OmpR family, alkaline phosphatase synthesis response regulator PhoP